MSSAAVARNTMLFSTQTTLVAASFQFAIQTFPKPQDVPAPLPTPATMSYAPPAASPVRKSSSRRTYRVDECDMGRSASTSWISNATRRLTPSTSLFKASNASSSSAVTSEELDWHLQSRHAMHFIGQQGIAPADSAAVSFVSGAHERTRMPGVAMTLARAGRGFVQPAERALDGWCKKGKGKRRTVRLVLEFPALPGAQPLRELVEMPVADASGRALSRAELAQHALQHYEAFFRRSVQSGKWNTLIKTSSGAPWDFSQLRLIALHFRTDESGCGFCIPEIGIIERCPPA